MKGLIKSLRFTLPQKVRRKFSSQGFIVVICLKGSQITTMLHWQECSVHTFAVRKQRGLINIYCNLIAQCQMVFISNHRAHIEKDILIKMYNSLFLSGGKEYP